MKHHTVPTLSPPWLWRSRPLDRASGSEVFVALGFDREPIATLLESPTRADDPRLSRYSIAAGRPRQLDQTISVGIPPVGEIFPWLRGLGAGTIELGDAPAHLPFVGGWLGWLGYDAAWEIERLPRLREDVLPFPVAYWYEPASFAVADELQDTLWLAATTEDGLDRLDRDWQNFLSGRTSLTPIVNPEPATTGEIAPNFVTTQADYEAMVRRAKDYIRAGDIFQTNLSLRFGHATAASGWQIYQALHRINPSPFASYWKTPWGEMASCSPERLVKLRDRRAETRPIAGTRPRGATPDADAAYAAELLANRKENAEHIMLVDLERNDLGRVCTWGSVAVDELLVIERYSHVMHLVSNVVGELAAERDAIDPIVAMFPGGTITGCPKVRCMEIIEELEPLRRSLFYGSCGYLDRRGRLDLNILIRTLLKVSDTAWGQVGAGIVADSDPTREWFESLAKAKAQLAAIAAVDRAH
ncbi:MAG: anthranilate synthase component I [Geitlerinemataceae cyanobacterium]|mgnify:CR=1 FL=1